MNKTVTINISGIVFHIEEDAFDRLKIYLDSLRRKFNAEEGRDEILADIESRIAEILTAKKGPSREVVVMNDVEEVIAMMGEPDVISDETSNSEPAGASAEANASNEHEGNSERRKRRRLFRDPDDRIVGGVCSGLGHYFDIDAVWIRLGFALLFFLGGTGILFYILLIIIIPRAETRAEKLEMRGEPVDVNNIRRSIKEEFEEFGNRVKDFGKEAKDWGKSGYDNNRHRSRYHRRGVEDVFRGIFHVIGRVFAFCLVFFGVLLLIGLLTSTFTITDFGPDMVTEQAKSLFDDGTSYVLAITAGLLFFGVPVLMIIYYGIKLLFRLQRKDKWVGLSALSFWILGVIMSIFSIMNIAAGFSEGSDSAERITVMNPHADTLSIRVSIDEDMENEDYHNGWNRRYRYEHRWKMISTDENTLKFGYAQLNIVPATGDSVELVIYKKAQGRTKQEAQERVRSMSYTIAQDSNGFIFPSAFTIGKDQAWKAQEIDMELRIPIGTVIFLHASSRDLLYDIDNVSQTDDNDMVDRRWKMTAQGLECVDCAGLEINRDYMHGDPNVIQPKKIDTLITGGDTVLIPQY